MNGPGPKTASATALRAAPAPAVQASSRQRRWAASTGRSSPGKSFAGYVYESGLFEEETKRVIADAILNWRAVLGEKLRAAAEAHPPAREVDLESLADMLTVVFEGAFVMARTLPSRSVFADQIRHYRNYLQLLFTG